jgi:deazaflavin-dependent oxidoreductase (nitroreductase family)
MAKKRRLVRAVGRRAAAIHVGMYRRSGGQRGGTTKGIPVLLITTTGRVSGQERTAPICYYRDGDRFVVAGTNGGMKHAAGWSLNLRADPRARIQVGAETFAVRAIEALGDDYEQLWAGYTERHPALAPYREKTTRRIPIWQLEPTDVATSRTTALDERAQL